MYILYFFLAHILVSESKWRKWVMLFLLFSLIFFSPKIRQSDNELSLSRSAHYVPLFLHLQTRREFPLCHVSWMLWSLIRLLDSLSKLSGVCLLVLRKRHFALLAFEICERKRTCCVCYLNFVGMLYAT